MYIGIEKITYMDFKWWKADMILNYLTIGCSFVFGPLYIWLDKARHGIGMVLASVSYYAQHYWLLGLFISIALDE